MLSTSTILDDVENMVAGVHSMTLGCSWVLFQNVCCSCGPRAPNSKRIQLHSSCSPPRNNVDRLAQRVPTANAETWRCSACAWWLRWHWHDCHSDWEVVWATCVHNCRSAETWFRPALLLVVVVEGLGVLSRWCGMSLSLSLSSCLPCRVQRKVSPL